MSLQNINTGEALHFQQMCPGANNFRIGERVKDVMDRMGPIGKAVYLDPANGDNGYDGLSADKPKLTFAAAYALLTANKNDVLYLIGNESGLTLPSAITWDKNYTHLIGLCAPVGAAKRARIFQLSTLTGADPLITVSASGCIFKNFYVFQGVNDATSKVNVKVTGGRNYFENVHFAGIGHATMDVAGAASLKLDGAEENYFKNCQIGLDSQGTRGANSTELWIDGGSNRNVFDGCLLYCYISNAGHATVTLEDGTAIDRYLIFKDCIFETDSLNQGVTQTQVFNIKAAIVQGKILLQNCMMLTDGASGSGAWDGNTRGIIFSNNVAPAAGAAGGIATKQ